MEEHSPEEIERRGLQNAFRISRETGPCCRSVSLCHHKVARVLVRGERVLIQVPECSGEVVSINDQWMTVRTEQGSLTGASLVDDEYGMSGVFKMHRQGEEWFITKRRD